jgi:serine/threonine-protein kinase RIO1
MRTLKLHFPDDALPTLDTFIKQTKEARVFRRAQAVRHVVKGQRLQTSHSRRRRMLLKINDLSHLAFVNIKSIESTTYAFYATSNGQVLN